MSIPAKLQLPQIERIRVDNTHIADALQKTVDYVNQNITPTAGNAVTPTNAQTARTQARVIPLNRLNG